MRILIGEVPENLDKELSVLSQDKFATTKEIYLRGQQSILLQSVEVDLEKLWEDLKSRVVIFREEGSVSQPGKINRDVASLFELIFGEQIAPYLKSKLEVKE
jgi:hypothetical protein